MKKIVLALSLVAFAASCRSTTDLNSSSIDGVAPAECCGEAGDCCDAAAACCSDAASECCSEKAEVCPVTGATIE